MKKISSKGIMLAYHLAVFIIVLTALYILKAGSAIYFQYRLKKDGYGPLLNAIDNMELTIEATQPVVWMAIGGAIMLVIVILSCWAFIDWDKLAGEMSVKKRIKKELEDFKKGLR